MPVDNQEGVMERLEQLAYALNSEVAEVQDDPDGHPYAIPIVGGGVTLYFGEDGLFVAMDTDATVLSEKLHGRYNNNKS